MAFKSSLSNVQVNEEPVFKIADQGLFYNALTVAQLTNLISTNKINPNAQYRITNPQDGGQILVSGASTNTVSDYAHWIYTTSRKAFGVFRLASGNTGSVTVLTVNGVSVISAAVPYNTSLVQTVTDLATNVNAYTATSGYKGYAVNDVLVLEYQTPSTASNGWVVAINTTGTLVADNINNLQKGEDPTTFVLPIVYEIGSDRITKCSDSNGNEMIMSLASIITNGFNSITKFRWNDSAYAVNRFVNCNFTEHFVQNTFSFNQFLGGQCQNNVCVGSTSVIQLVNMATSGFFNKNYTIGSGWIYANFYGNGSGGASSISNNQITANTNAGGILGNLLIGTGNTINNNILTLGGRVDYNILSSRNTAINNNTVNAATNPGIRYNTIDGFGATISSNSLTGTTSTIQYNKVSGQSSSINSNILNNASVTIQSNILLGASTTLNSNNLTNSTASIIGNVLSGQSSAINTNTLGIASSTINGNALEAQGAVISGYTFDATLTSISRIQWLPDNCIRMNLQSGTLTGAANAGLSGSPVNIGVLPVAKAYAVEVVFEGNGLVGVGSSGQVGIETDNTSALLGATVIGSLNAIITNYATTKTKSAAANRRIQFIPSGANMTAGSVQVFVEFKVSKY